MTASHNDMLLEVRDVRKAYGEVTALAGVSLGCRRGEVYGLLGPNGAGKSTLIGIISAMLPPDGGAVTLDGLDVLAQPRQVKRRLGVVPQDLALYEKLSARENLRFFGELYGVAGGRLKQRVGELIRQLQLEEAADRPVRTYSGGMKRRLNIGASLLHDPPLLLLDEPTVGIDPQTRHAIYELVEQQRASGVGLVYTTHYMEEAQRLCDRVGIIDHGRMIAEGTIAELLARLPLADQVQIDFLDPPALQPDRFRRAVPAVEELALSGNRLTVLVKDADRTLGNISSALRDQGLEPSSLLIEKPNLESVFLALTGRQLREA